MFGKRDQEVGGDQYQVNVVPVDENSMVLTLSSATEAIADTTLWGLTITNCRSCGLDSEYPECRVFSRRLNPWVGWEGPGSQGRIDNCVTEHP